MKPHKIIFSLAAIVAFIYIGLTVYVICVPSITTVAWVYWQVLFNKEWKGAMVELKEKNIPVSNSANGAVIDEYGYSFRIQGYKVAQMNGEKNDFSQEYKFDDEKFLIINNYAEHGMKENFSDYFKQNHKQYKLIESAMGRPMNTDYDWHYDLQCASLKDFTLFDNKKNIGVALALTYKSLGASNVKELYQFRFDNIVGLETIRQGGGNTLICGASFCDKNNLNRMYGIVFLGDWTEAEVDAAIGTIRFDQ